ncbi:MAG: SpoIID/LytB domain-containing protein [Solirubrobacterales bacterium]
MAMIRIGLAGALAASLLAAPVAADAAWTVKGRGFGHGVGLSQYGAYGFAQQGRSYKQILDHYYRKTRVGKAANERVRILLGSGQGSVGFSGARSACGERIDPGRDYVLTYAAGRVELNRGGERLAACGGEGAAKGRGGVDIEGFGRYRGSLVAHADGGDLLVINSLGLEDYVKGVVPNEVPSSWPKHALRAQAVVARSYGLATERSGAFDHYADTRSQVYGGRGSETRATNKAVKATRRQVVKHGGRPAITYYFSTSGGQTENSEFGFSGGNPLPYLKSVKDPFDDISPVHKWTMKFSDDEMEQELDGLFGGELRAIEVIKRGRSPRIVRARVVGSNKSTEVTGDTLRARLGLRSTWAKFLR